MPTLDVLASLLGWTAVINLALLSLVFCFWLAMRRAVYRLHRRWFELEPRQINAILYGLLGGWKLANLLLFVAPWLALKIVGS